MADSWTLVQGASRGLGFTLSALLAERGAHVFATAREPAASAELLTLAQQHPGRVVLCPLDVRDEASIVAAVETLAQHTRSLDLVLNVAGVLNGNGRPPERRIEDLDPAAMADAFATNAIGPLVLARHLYPYLKHDGRAVFATLSARVGSISDNAIGGWYSVRASKAAQNQLLKTLSIELQRRAKNVICVALHPGTVDTDMSKPFQRTVAPGKLFSRERAARQLLDIVDGLTAEDTGSFIAWDGQRIPW
ncbi:MAG: SDR family oxidoreductase [Sandaracinaceae bacterium]|nr:SDR family oxidoreductase [Sandaracinaceae bacterium]